MRIVRALALAAPGTTDAIAERVAATPEQVDTPAVSAELTSELRRLLVEPVVLVKKKRGRSVGFVQGRKTRCR